jgi:ABC-type nitrate/sulfonate/bicarbonate transport system permease component
VTTATPAGTPVGPGTAGVGDAAGSAANAVLRQAGRSLLTIVIAVVVLGVLWTALLKVFGVSSFVGKSPLDVWQYLFSDAPARGVRPTSLSAQAAREASFGALATTVVNAAIGFVSGMVLATAIAVGFVLWRPFELAFMPIALLLRSVPLVAMAPLLLLVFGQGKLGIAVIAGIVVLFPALVNIVLGLSSASQAALDVVKVNGGSAFSALVRVRIPAALPQFLASARISVPGAIVGSMLAEWLVGFAGMGGVLSGYKGQGNYGGVWTIVALAVLVSIVLYEVTTIVETALLARWGPEAGVVR